jgi:C4-type Zn-finger protein
MTLNRKCPACGNDLGLARQVSTVPGRKDIVVVVMVCGSCAHEWTAENESHAHPLEPYKPQPQ